ncbi:MULTISPECIES: DUF7352 domain-containing protein [Bacillus]|uniref:DUF7352 domain-containing protein n=1 Tax=Bacillus TaxID=1386 RepID=UPI0011A34502|nr:MULTISPECIES: hypothetical protein [Bacillus subtilis group]MCY8636423.1 hypothetical protein [Bacillus sp. S17B2]MBT3123193.1 hypothetical protein [Bacillus inaquosorum]MCB5337352.1 hypothetical protein [Bacillus amyloliquefaciens]MCF7615390.1 hypothetical protein [Bacillus subtilis]QWK35316.1 hypothetical protein KM843_19315 [Bacillus velezensis]
MNCVWKYKLDHMVQKVELPVGAKILSAVIQDGHVVVYAFVNSDEEKKETVEFVTQSTGESSVERLNEYTFLDTVMTANGLVFHIFYK